MENEFNLASGALPVRLEAPDADASLLVSKCSPSFLRELSVQITKAVEDTFYVSGIADSGIVLTMVFAPGTFMEHTSENVTYRRLVMSDGSRVTKDFWIKWERLDAVGIGFSVSDEVSADTIRFSVGEDAPQKVREKEYRYLAATGAERYRAAMGRKNATAWHEFLKRAEKRGTLSMLEKPEKAIKLEQIAFDLTAKEEAPAPVTAPQAEPAPRTDDIPRMEDSDDVLREKLAALLGRNLDETASSVEPAAPEEDTAFADALRRAEAFVSENTVTEDAPTAALTASEEPIEEPIEESIEEPIEEPAEETDEDIAPWEESPTPDAPQESADLSEEAEVPAPEVEIPYREVKVADPAYAEQNRLAEKEAELLRLQNELLAKQQALDEREGEIRRQIEDKMRVERHDSERDRLAELARIAVEEEKERASAEQAEAEKVLQQEAAAEARQAEKNAELERAKEEIAAKEAERQAALGRAAEAERLLAEWKAREEARREEERREQEAARIAEEQARIAEAERIERESREAEEKRLAEERAAEERRMAEERLAESARVAQLLREEAEREVQRRETELTASTVASASEPTPEYTYVRRVAHLAFRGPLDPMMPKRIHTIMQDTVRYFGKENVFISVRASIVGDNRIDLDFLRIPKEENELLVNIIKVLGNSNLGITRVVLDNES